MVFRLGLKWYDNLWCFEIKDGMAIYISVDIRDDQMIYSSFTFKIFDNLS